MTDIRQKLNALGLEVPSILLPKPDIDLQKWAVIACDQFTQDRGYWEKIELAVYGSPSTLNLVFPEAFLGEDDAQRIASIRSSMTRYLNEGVFADGRQGFVYMERDTPFYKKRAGLVAAVDLEKYEWQSGSRPLIRCTEGTVEERLPPRMDIRRGAPLELPHVLLLIDDETNSVLPSLGELAKNNKPVYETPLMMDSGSVTGWFISEEQLSKSKEQFIKKFEELCARSLTRYEGNTMPFLFAVGDGNHSLAAAKGIWEEYKAGRDTEGGEPPDHPCRYALVEIENIYDPAIKFEPIHRVLLGAGFDDALALLSKLPNFSYSLIDSQNELSVLCGQSDIANRFGLIAGGKRALIKTSAMGIATACLQPLLDDFTKANPAVETDYIHDEAELFRLCEPQKKTAGILLPPVQKAGLFETVARQGPLPRKSFSMGHSAEKRFYFECRRLG